MNYHSTHARCQTASLPSALSSLLAYTLPSSQIATQPANPRDSARLLFLDRTSQSLRDLQVRDLPSLLPPNDLLVLNNSKVIPARLICSQNRTELLLLEETSPGWWTALGTPAKRLAPGTDLFPDPLEGAAPTTPSLRVEKTIPGGQLVIRSLVEKFDLHAFGRPPLPPYILKSRKAHGQPDFDPTDIASYQTTYAKIPGSVAAPTAGLHFTSELLAQLPHAFVTLHVGLGTFRPVKTADFRDHPMHEERYEIGPGLEEKIAAAHRVIAVGTTSARVLESAPHLRPHTGSTAAYLYPPYQFKRVQGLLTNFHLPHSTLLLLVAAFAGPELALRAYEHAIREKYRFYSYGDAMLIL
jgi:S-adenosylmethionine:tRNA ribosyltransferase-isomerase